MFLPSAPPFSPAATSVQPIVEGLGALLLPKNTGVAFRVWAPHADSVSVVGQPTNSFGSNMWFVPYRLRFKNGSEKEWQLHIAQDPQSQKWYFKGGF